jgi:hypothetical protein
MTAHVHSGYCRSTRCWRAASARKRSMHSGFERPRGALHGVNAHQARASMPEPSQAFLAGGADLATVLDACALGRAVRWRSRGATRAACGAAVERGGTVDTPSAARPDPAPDAGCASGFSQSATGSGLGDRTGSSSGDDADGAARVSMVTRVIADGGVAAVVGIGATAGGAMIVVVVAASGSQAAVPEGSTEGRSRVQAPQPSATMPVKASETATLR